MRLLRRALVQPGTLWEADSLVLPGWRSPAYGAMQHRVLIARFDPATGSLTLDDRFREAGATEHGFRMDDKSWPHGSSVKDIPHGAVFSRP